MIQGILDVETGVIQKIVHLNLSGQGRDEVTEFYQRGRSFR